MGVFHGIDGLRAAVGEHLGYSRWRTVTQHEVDLFANATGDRQWIHVDPEPRPDRSARPSRTGT